MEVVSLLSFYMVNLQVTEIKEKQSDNISLRSFLVLSILYIYSAI